MIVLFEYSFIVLISILFYVQILQHKIIILLKIFDIVGPPAFIKTAIQKLYKSYIQKNTNYNYIKPKKNAIYLLIPHGATFFPALRLPMLYNIENEYPLFFVNKWFLLIPGFVGLVKLFSNVISNERGNLKLAILQTARPLIIYPNGTAEMFKKNVPINEKLLKLLLKSRKYIHIVSIKNESDCFYFGKYVRQFFSYINQIWNIGIPFPPPYYTSKKLQLKISKAINTRKIEKISTLRRIIKKRLK